MSTETETKTDRRELVARAMWEHRITRDLNQFGARYVVNVSFDETPEHIQKSLRNEADAVLAALEPWLLPELPELPHWAWSLVVEGVNSPIVSATVEEGVDDDSSTSRYLSGTGPTVPAAIRDALEGGQR